MAIDFNSYVGGMTGSANPSVTNTLTYGNKLTPNAAPKGGSQIKLGTFTTIDAMSATQLQTTNVVASSSVTDTATTESFSEWKAKRDAEMKNSFAGSTAAATANMSPLEKVAYHYKNDIASISWADIAQQQTTSANKVYDICKTKPYFECTACGFSKSKLGVDSIVAKLLGFKALDKYLNDGLNRGDTGAADMLTNCPGRQRELSMQGFSNSKGFLGSAQAAAGVVGTVASNTATIAKTAQSGNATLFKNLSTAAVNGDMRPLATSQFSSLSKNLVQNSDTAADMVNISNTLGVKSSSLMSGTIPESGVIDLSRVSRMNGLSTSNMTTLLSSAPGAAYSDTSKLQDSLKRSSSISSRLGIGTPASDVSGMSNRVRKTLSAQIGKEEANKFL